MVRITPGGNTRPAWTPSWSTDGTQVAYSHDQANAFSIDTFSTDPKTSVGDKLPDLVVVRCVAGAAYFDLTLVGKMPLVLATRHSFAQKPHGGPTWTVRPGVKLTIVRITAEAGEKNRVKGALELSDGKGKNENRAFTLAPGETKTLECTEQDGWESIGYSIMHGKTQVVVVEDYRAPEDRKPF